MTEAQNAVMIDLRKTGPSSAPEVAQRLGCSARVAGHTLTALFRRNLATIDDDGRTWRLTARGHKRMEAAGVRAGQAAIPEPTRLPAIVPKPSVKPQDEDKDIPVREQGVIVTAREQVSERLLTIHRSGRFNVALRSVCRTLDKLPGDWKVVTISTPNSILRDLQGTRGLVGERFIQGGDVTDGSSTELDIRRETEKSMLGKIGRLDLYEPTQRTIIAYPRNIPPRPGDVAA